jgi:capsular polysaccharide transport system permease protein
MSDVAGGNASLSTKAAAYQRLALERDFADRQLAASMASLEQARNDAQRKQLYLERIVQPNLPDVAIEPRRLHAVLVVFLMGLVTTGALSILLAGVREHRD